MVGGADDIQFLGAKTYGVSYIQDGQASTNAIFGTIGNSAPGLDAISEITVLSNSYSAEYGGLAGVVVTTKRGASSYRGTSFYDFNSDSLNALTYNQTLSGVQRGDPLADTHEHRWGGSIGGPLVGSKMFFYANYEGSNNKSIFGGGRATVPTAAMRNGDFRGTAIAPRDPTTGQPFADQVIPSDRIDPAARAIMDFFYPLPNQGTMANGYGVYQQFVPQTRDRQRGDIRVDYEPSSNDSVFVRGSYQHRNPNNIIFEAGNAFTNLPMLNTKLNTASVIGGWTKIFAPTVVNEFRAGYNYDNSGRESTFLAADVTAQLGIENAPSLGADRRGFPSVPVHGGNEPADQHRRCRTQRRPHASAERLLAQRQHHVDQGRPHAQGRRPLDPQHRSRRVWLRRQFPRPVSVPRRLHRQRVHRFPARDACRRARSGDEPWTARGPLQRHRALRPGRLAGEQEA